VPIILRLICGWALTKNLDSLKHGIGKPNDALSLFSVGIMDAVTANPISGSDQQLKRDGSWFQLDGKAKGLTVLMGGLHFIQHMILQGDPVQIVHLGRAITLIQIGLELFIVSRSEFIDTVLFHVASNCRAKAKLIEYFYLSYL
jgi:hypothetical protein